MASPEKKRWQSTGGVSKKMKIILHSTESEKSEVIPGDVSSDDECSPHTFDFEEYLTESEKSKDHQFRRYCLPIGRRWWALPVYTRLARECQDHQFRRYSFRIGQRGRHEDFDERLARECEDYQSWRNLLISDALPAGALAEHLEDFDKLFPIYTRQAIESEGYDIDDFPGLVKGGLTPIWWLKPERMHEQMMELAEWAIREYNEKKRNKFKYKVLKIEKANRMLGGLCEYFMTVKVLNITLGTPIETFQIGGAIGICNDVERRIYLCRPKEEGAMAAIKAVRGWFAKSNVPKCCCC